MFLEIVDASGWTSRLDAKPMLRAALSAAAFGRALFLHLRIQPANGLLGVCTTHTSKKVASKTSRVAHLGWSFCLFAGLGGGGEGSPRS